MKILLDIDETITECPEFFSAFSKAMLKDGHEIHVVTARDGSYYKDLTEKQLKEWDIPYTVLVFNWEKLAYCHDNDIKAAFDDNPDWFGNRFGGMKREDSTICGNLIQLHFFNNKCKV